METNNETGAARRFRRRVAAASVRAPRHVRGGPGPYGYAKTMADADPDIAVEVEPHLGGWYTAPLASSRPALAPICV